MLSEVLALRTVDELEEILIVDMCGYGKVCIYLIRITQYTCDSGYPHSLGARALSS